MVMNAELLMYFARVELAQKVAAAEQRRRLRIYRPDSEEDRGEHR